MFFKKRRYKQLEKRVESIERRGLTSNDYWFGFRRQVPREVHYTIVINNKKGIPRWAAAIPIIVAVLVAINLLFGLEWLRELLGISGNTQKVP